MSNKVFDYDPMHQYVEKERTRTLIIEATKQESITSYWRQVIVVVILSLAGGGYIWFQKSQTGRDLLEAINQDPLKEKRARMRPHVPRPNQDPDKFVEDANTAWSQQENFDQAVQNGVINHDGAAPAASAAAATAAEGAPEELLKMQKTREALGKQLEAVGEGRALPPSADVVNAAMAGKAMPPAMAAPLGVPGNGTAARSPAAASADAAPGGGIEAGDRDGSLPPTLEAVANSDVPVMVAPVYRQISQVPAPYLREKKEFPDLP